MTKENKNPTEKENMPEIDIVEEAIEESKTLKETLQKNKTLTEVTKQTLNLREALKEKETFQQKALKFQKKIITVYGLVKVIKKEIKKILTSFDSNLIFIGLLPILGYGLDNNSKIFSYNSLNNFLQNTLPGSKSYNLFTASKFTSETFNYTNYFNKINWNELNNINYFDGSLFLSFNSDSYFYNKKNYIGISNSKNFIENPKQNLSIENLNLIQNNNETSKTFFLAGRNYNKFINVESYLPIDNNVLLNHFKKISYWQDFFSELDDIPTELNSIYFNSINLIESNLNPTKNQCLESTLFSDFDELTDYITDIKYQDENRKALEQIKLNKLVNNSNETLNWAPALNLDTKTFNVELQTKKSKKFDFNNFNEINNLIFETETPIENQTNQLNLELYQHQTNDNLWNTRAFQYKIYSITCLLKDFINFQINNFNNKEDLSFNNFLNQKVLDSKLKIQNNKKENSKSVSKTENEELTYLDFEKRKGLDLGQIWQLTLRKDLRNFGNTTKISQFLPLTEINLESNFGSTISMQNKGNLSDINFYENAKYENLNSIFSSTIQDEIKGKLNLELDSNTLTNILSKNEFNRHKSLRDCQLESTQQLTQQNIQQKKLTSKQVEQSLIPHFQDAFLSYVNKELDNEENSIFSLGFNRNVLSNYSNFVELINKESEISLNIQNNQTLQQNQGPVSFKLFIKSLTKCFENWYCKKELFQIKEIHLNTIESSTAQKIIQLKNAIKKEKSDLIKRKVSGYLYPDHIRDELIMHYSKRVLNPFQLFGSKQFNYLQIEGPNEPMYWKVKQIANTQNESIDDAMKKFHTTLNLQTSPVPYAQSFFEDEMPDYFVEINQTPATKNIKTEESQSSYIANLSLNYIEKYLDTKTPFLFSQSSLKKEWDLNNIPYYNNINKPIHLDSSKSIDSILSNKINQLKQTLNFNPTSSEKKENIENNLAVFSEYNLTNQSETKVSVSDFKPFINPTGLNEIPTEFIGYQSHSNYTKISNPLIILGLDLTQFQNFSTDLYQRINLQKWSFLTHISFILILFKFLQNLKEDYRDSLKSAIETFLFNFELRALTNLKSINQSMAQSTKIKFNNLVGGATLLEEFTQTILLLRNSKKSLSRLILPQPAEAGGLSRVNWSNFKLGTAGLGAEFKSIQTKQTIVAPLSKGTTAEGLNSNTINSIDVIETIDVTRGFLIVGPPGTGKTLLVKALSGECEIPIVLESGEKISRIARKAAESSETAKGALQLKQLFNIAKRKSPCILFLDEIDTIGQNRQDVLTDEKNPFGSSSGMLPNSVQFLYSKKQVSKKNILKENNLQTISQKNWNIFNPILSNHDLYQTSKLITSSTEQQSSSPLSSKSLAMLTQLLCELDGIKNNQDIVIIGATNRPEALDPALVRPGRLNKVIYLDLPGKQKRFQLLKFSSKLNANKQINWDYFANQTIGFSAAHLTAAMNLSALKSVYQHLNSKKSWTKQFFELNKNILNSKLKNSKQIEKKSPINHSFETIELAIESFRSKNSNSQYENSQRGYKMNSLIFGPTFYNKLLSLSAFIEKIDLINDSKLNLILPLHKNQRINLFYPKNFVIYEKTKKGTNFTTHLSKTNKGTDISLEIEKNLDNFTFKSNIVNDEKNLLSQQKKQSRKNFYESHKKYLRTLYLLHESNLLELAENKNKQLKKLNLSKETILKIQKFNSYVTHVFQVNLFGCQLLTNSTCFIKNPLMFSLNYKNRLFTNQNVIKYKLLYSKNTNCFFNSDFNFNTDSKFESNFENLTKGPKITNSETKDKGPIQKGINKNKILKNESQEIIDNLGSFSEPTLIGPLVFKPHFYINRAVYYISGKALILSILNEPIFYLKPLSLASIIQKSYEQQIDSKEIFPILSKQLLTRIKFESYLLSIIAGKAAETLLLKNSNFKNSSNIGINELQQIGWILNIMIEKKLFYKPLQLASLKQINIPLLKNLYKTTQTETQTKNQFTLDSIEHKLNRLVKIFDVNKLQDLYSTNTETKSLKFHNIRSWTWQKIPSLIKSKHQNSLFQSNFGLSYGKWSSCFTNSTQKTIQPTYLSQMSKYDKYFQNLITHLTFINNQYEDKKILDNEKSIENFEFTNFNKEFVKNFFQVFEVNWNSLQFIESNFIISSLIFESFNKSFEILENNRDLLDYFAYYFLCHDRLYEFEIKEISNKFFEELD